MKICTYSSCDRPAKYKTPKSICSTHYHQWWRKNKGKVKSKRGSKKMIKGSCSVTGCKREVKYKSPRLFCATHYHSWWRKYKQNTTKKYNKRGRPPKKVAVDEESFISTVFSFFKKIVKKQ